MAINAVNSLGLAPITSDSAMRQQSHEENGLFERLLRRQSETSETSAGNSGRIAITTDDEKTLFEQCQALETFLMKTLVSGMRKTVMKSELIDTGYAGEMYEDMLYDEYAKSFTENAHFGLAELAYLDLTGRRGQKLSIQA
jgi:flagellar protein FlgJ